ncbi:hypothetical protein CPB83DRAFT_393453 [Crepidotus variabilis]|uniref:Uncharacterized protein n=1 Tax=Crepidotus variabilis TaxID=179855 RepID=A0A9P6EDS5_9AGAR|nr:hypothetical protein CPB83DRAFT_393453 [Crepidotus variabilis]
MAIIEGGGENDLTQLWSLITELSEQLNQNRSMSVSLYGVAGKIKTEALNSQTGFVLRRFNLDKTKEEYETQLEGMNAAMTQENFSLQNDNKQLNALIKEYEQTLETLMSAFRNRAVNQQDVQERELSLIRDFEAKLLAREEENATRDLLQTSSISNSLVRLSHLLRQILRAQNGESTEAPPPPPPIPPFTTDPDTNSNHEAEGSSSSSDLATEAEPEPELSDHALERDIELARLERENEELRRLIGLLPPHPRKESHHGSDFRPIFDPPHPTRLPSMQRQMSGSNIGSNHGMIIDGSDQVQHHRLGMRLLG